MRALTENEEQIFDEIFPRQINLKSFERKNKLCPKIWRNGDMKKIVRARLLEIAKNVLNDFEEFPLKVEDIIVVGSIAGYNWTQKFSDIDLHFLIDFSKFRQYGTEEVLKALLQKVKNDFNNKHSIKIFGFEVEIYFQSTTENNESDGIYSVLYGKWIKIPKMKDATLDRELIKTQAAQYINIIDKIEELSNRNLSQKQAELLHKVAQNLNDEIMQGRKQGLADAGENAPGNIVFKVLRRTEHIGKLKQVITKLFDKICSLY